MAATDLDFRLATTEDAVALERLINTAFLDDSTTQVFLTPQRSTNVIDVPTIIATIEKPDCVVLAATDPSTGSVVAHASVRKLDGRRAWFGMLAVDVGYQKRGIGGRVLAWAEETAKHRWGSPRLEFDVVNRRAELIAWYKARGYEPTGDTSPFPYDRHPNWQGLLRDDLCFINLGKDLEQKP
ncbi:acyl-CoA N-acyltransferase [Xylaria arbuscula]|uniref:N-acetyltransferase domain-containing protein n=1 Tax=Xylaria arbuscula TaxID=114810 RepID=A0A9W8TKV3_9PEZI|nr:acyl-CoA N-acyltransferase [Xylaria arbuscula]KAJ3569845.1 hypothetical protein NPX13_g5940 [Xylaria arbuscula]